MSGAELRLACRGDGGRGRGQDEAEVSRHRDLEVECLCGFCVEVFRSSGTAVLTLGGEIWVGDKGLGLIPMWTVVTSRVQEFTEG